MLLVDLRNHGHSSALHQLRPPHSIQAAAEDVVKLIGELLPPSSHPSRCGAEEFSWRFCGVPVAGPSPLICIDAADMSTDMSLPTHTAGPGG